MVDTLKGESLCVLGFDLRRVRKRTGDGYFILMTPKKARQAIKRGFVSSSAGGGNPAQGGDRRNQRRVGGMGELLSSGQCESSL